MRESAGLWQINVQLHLKKISK